MHSQVAILWEYLIFLWTSLLQIRFPTHKLTAQLYPSISQILFYFSYLIVLKSLSYWFFLKFIHSFSFLFLAALVILQLKTQLSLMYQYFSLILYLLPFLPQLLICLSISSNYYFHPNCGRDLQIPNVQITPFWAFWLFSYQIDSWFFANHLL